MSEILGTVAEGLLQDSLTLRLVVAIIPSTYDVGID